MTGVGAGRRTALISPDRYAGTSPALENWGWAIVSLVAEGQLKVVG